MQETQGGRTLLLIEDDNEVRAIFSEVFQGEGYRVLEAGNGADAYDILTEGKDLINVVLTDLRMPIMDGLKFATKIKKRYTLFRNPSRSSQRNSDAELLNCSAFF